MLNPRKLWLGAFSFFVLAALVAGCNGFFVNEDDSGDGTLQPRFVYTANSGSNDVSAFVVNTSTGDLTPATTFSMDIATPNSVGADADGFFLYVANEGGGVSGFVINRNNGNLAQVAGSPFTPGTNFAAVAVDPAARFVYAAESGAGNVFGYGVTAGTGVLAPVPNSPFPSAGAPIRLSVDPTGRFVYVAMGAAGTDVFRINTDGSLTLVENEPSTAGRESHEVVVEPTGHFAFVADGMSGVAAYAVNASTGELTLVSGSPFAAGTEPVGVAVDPDGVFLYTANQGSNNVSVFRINANGTLTAGTAVAAGTNPVSLAVDPSGRFLYVANQGGSPDISIYTINSTSGALSSAGSEDAGTNSESIVATP